MFYYLAVALIPRISALNVLTYHTVRAGGAALTGFILCLILGPWVIRQLRALKVGQFIKKEHVADLHALHKGKAGTPTMGGVLILLSTTLSLFLWSPMDNRLLWVALGALLMLGIVGFLDDFIKLRRKHNDGLSARAKFAGQILTGGVMGLYLLFNPITVNPTYLFERDMTDWTPIARAIREAQTPATARIWNALNPQTQTIFREAGAETGFHQFTQQIMVQQLNELLEDPTLFTAEQWVPEADSEADGLLRRGRESLSTRELLRLNRLFLEHAIPDQFTATPANLHTRVGVPGFKSWLIPLGPLYVFFVIFIIVSISNAVNLTDGLDGLAAGASVVSIAAFAAIAYVVSRADWSSYLYLMYVPEASELFVFGAALLGTGLGFLWYNAHPAEVFMGDTGSLALGGAIGTMAILTKQELLLPIIAGLFVMEAASVVIQVASFKLTGKRVFRMAPLHHHFELLGWSETKVTMRFWIIAFLFAIMSLGTLKLR
ncbi:MAG: phospho-N-acetylmuramoyl-pentapeptide-transferase [Candidatus Hydrogenedentes bacterium]|nr:phospho-N-acetylmuramoyl-pentapeptide-transferase [Candidatus Hydrogenedentota bacterium]